MGKIILFNMVTLDGFFEGPGGDIDWHMVDDEFNQFSIQQIESADGLIFGRVTYELMASYWPTPAANEDNPEVADRMNTIPKVVFSRTLEHTEWHNTRLVNGEAADEVRRLKGEPGGDLFIFGSANLASGLIAEGLIDEFRLMVNPVILGQGRPLFEGIEAPLKLTLVDRRVFGNGNVLLFYQP